MPSPAPSLGSQGIRFSDGVRVFVTACTDCVCAGACARRSEPSFEQVLACSLPKGSGSAARHLRSSCSFTTVGVSESPAAQGANCLELAFVYTDWIFRRVEGLRMEAAGTTTVRVSLDISTGIYKLPIGPAGGRVIPLAVAAKGPISRLDVTTVGYGVSVLTTAQNSKMVASALVSLATGIVEESDSFAPRFAELCEARLPEADILHSALVSDMKLVPSHDVESHSLLRLLLEQLVDSYVLLVELHGDLPERLTVKYSYDAGQDALLDADVRENRLTWSLGTYAMACSSHVEVEVPHPLVIERSEIVEWGETQSDVVASCSIPSGIHHLVAVPKEALSSAEWVSTVKVVESTATRAALFSSAAAALLCAYLFVGTWGRGLLGASELVLEPSASLLLAVAGLIGPVVGRAPRHWLVAKFVKPFRNITSAAGVILFATALIVGTVVGDGFRELMQAILLFGALVLTGVALAFRRRVSGRRTLASKGRR